MSWLRIMEESIQENASSGTEDKIQSVQPGVPSKKHSVGGLIRDMWPAYLIEIFVIILGISITLALEQWRDASREESLEKIYINNLQADLNNDLNNMHIVLSRTQRLMERGNELLGFSRADAVNATYNQVCEDIRSILDRPRFISNDATFSDLKSSGNLHLLKNIQLKNLLFAYYGQSQVIREVQDAELQATIVLAGSYFLKHFSLDTSGRKDFPQPENLSVLLQNVEFENNVLLRVSNRKELFMDYKKADSLALRIGEVLVK